MQELKQLNVRNFTENNAHHTEISINREHYINAITIDLNLLQQNSIQYSRFNHNERSRRMNFKYCGCERQYRNCFELCTPLEFSKSLTQNVHLHLHTVTILKLFIKVHSINIQIYSKVLNHPRYYHGICMAKRGVRTNTVRIFFLGLILYF